jgi:hypothetical protein
MRPSTERLQQIATCTPPTTTSFTASSSVAAAPSLRSWRTPTRSHGPRLLTADQVNLHPPRWLALAWLTTVAVQEAWRLNSIDRRAGAFDPEMVDPISIGRERAVPGAHEVAAQHLRLELVSQIPERPRRFLLRLALGYSYDEISAAEGVSHTTTNRQIARAKPSCATLTATRTPRGTKNRPPSTLRACRQCCAPARMLSDRTGTTTAIGPAVDASG